MLGCDPHWGCDHMWQYVTNNTRSRRVEQKNMEHTERLAMMPVQDWPVLVRQTILDLHIFQWNFERIYIIISKSNVVNTSPQIPPSSHTLIPLFFPSMNPQIVFVSFEKHIKMNPQIVIENHLKNHISFTCSNLTWPPWPPLALPCPARLRVACGRPHLPTRSFPSWPNEGCCR